MESIENPMMISSVLVFEQPIPLAELRQLLEQRFLRFRRFRQRVVHQGDRAYWEDDPLFDINNHLHSIALPGKGEEQDLQALVSDLNSTALDFRRPLWQLHYIDHYQGGCALIMRIHHCIADGISLVRVLLSLTDNSPHPRTRSRRPAPGRPVSDDSSLRRLISVTRETAQAATEQASLFLKSIRTEPGYPIKLLSAAGNISLDLIRLGLAPYEPETCLKTPLSGRKQVAWAEPLDLAEAKLCARALGGTVNDVLLCAAAGALQKHFINTRELVPDCGIRVAVPFNLRSLRQPIEDLGNQFGLVLVNLPIEVSDPIMRFRQVQENMNRLKRSYQAQVSYSLLNLFGRGPDVLGRRAIGLLSRKATAVLTNVPGPKKPVYLAGARLTQPMFWVPQTGNIGIGMSIFSYAGSVQFGITIDRNIQADPTAVMELFRDSFFELRDLAQQRKPNRHPNKHKRNK